MNDKTGGPAFPEDINAFAGMTLVDYFAAKAMEVMLRDYIELSDETRQEILETDYPEKLAIKSYGIAEAMIKEKHRREKVDE